MNFLKSQPSLKPTKPKTKSLSPLKRAISIARALSPSPRTKSPNKTSDNGYATSWQHDTYKVELKPPNHHNYTVWK